MDPPGRFPPGAPPPGRLPEEVLCRARLVGDEERGYFWMAPADVFVCNVCGWKYAGRDADLMIDGAFCIRRVKSPDEKKRTAGTPGPLVRRLPDGELACGGKVWLSWHLLERLSHAMVISYSRGRQWKLEGSPAGDARGASCWRKWFTKDGGMRRKPKALEGLA